MSSACLAHLCGEVTLHSGISLSGEVATTGAGGSKSIERQHKYKTALCRNFESGGCQYGWSCKASSRARANPLPSSLTLHEENRTRQS